MASAHIAVLGEDGEPAVVVGDVVLDDHLGHRDAPRVASAGTVPVIRCLRRGVIVELTREGLAVVGQVRALIHRRERDWMGVLTGDELEAYIGLLHRVQERLSDEA